ncbi:hypothetical protein ABW21_db0208465 [Orbilia brochopaga]|nr:hypothetical protein ABW21_db0208465 [Drechslerella brochopaga]
MSSKAASPTASLIRHSRLMAMPAPRSSSHAALSDSQIYRPPYPTHQAITTPESSRHRGDWGLKRPIPRKVASSYLRYNDIDTIQHRTTFESSHDTVITLKKWQEMGIPIKLFDQLAGRFTSAFLFDDVPSVSLSNGSPASALSDDASSSSKSAGITAPIWGYREKFIQHMTPGELKTFIDTKLVPRRLEFQQFAKQFEAKQKPTSPATTTTTTTTTTTALEQTDSEAPNPEDALPPEENAESPASDIPQRLSPPSSALHPHFTAEPIPAEVRKMRHDSITAVNGVRAFLKIPLRQAPMTTHPSGGLYYILDASYLENHPLLGPMPDKLVPARSIHKLDLKLADASWRRRSYYLISGFAIYATQDQVNRNYERAFNLTGTLNLSPIAADLDQAGKVRIDFDNIAPHQMYTDMIETSAHKIRMQLDTGKGTLAAVRAAGGSSQKTQQEQAGSSSGQQPLLTDRHGRSPPQSDELQTRLVSLLTRLNVAGGRV